MLWTQCAWCPLFAVFIFLIKEQQFLEADSDFWISSWKTLTCVHHCLQTWVNKTLLREAYACSTSPLWPSDLALPHDLFQLAQNQPRLYTLQTDASFCLTHSLVWFIVKESEVFEELSLFSTWSDTDNEKESGKKEVEQRARERKMETQHQYDSA